MKPKQKKLTGKEKISQTYHALFKTTKYKNDLELNELKQSVSAILQAQINILRITDIASHYIRSYFSDVVKSMDMDEVKQNIFMSEKRPYYRKKIQKLSDILIKNHRDHPEQLRKYFNNESPYFAGLCTTAYFSLTGGINPALQLEFGGIGAYVHDTAINLHLERSQFLFSTISVRAFDEVNLDSVSLYGSLIHINSDKKLSRTLPLDCCKVYDEHKNESEKEDNK